MVSTASTFAETEDGIAELHEQLAIDHQDRTAHFRRIAEEAREGARRARGIAEHFRE